MNITIEELLKALKVHSELRLDPVIYVATSTKGYQFHVTPWDACKIAAEYISRRLAQDAEPVAWADKAMELATDFAINSLRVGSYERKDQYENNYVATDQTVSLREKREASRDRLRQYLYSTSPQAAQTEATSPGNSQPPI